jgi:antitoxin VapB
MSTVNGRIFKNGNSQAVRIPHEFRLNAERVEITRTKDGDLLIHPVTENRGTQLLAILNDFDDDFVAILEQDQSGRARMQDRDDL